MSSTYFEPEGSSSGRRLYTRMQLWFGIKNMELIVESIVLTVLFQSNQDNRLSSKKNNKYKLLYT